MCRLFFACTPAPCSHAWPLVDCRAPPQGMSGVCADTCWQLGNNDKQDRAVPASRHPSSPVELQAHEQAGCLQQPQETLIGAADRIAHRQSSLAKAQALDQPPMHPCLGRTSAWGPGQVPATVPKHPILAVGKEACLAQQSQADHQRAATKQCLLTPAHLTPAPSLKATVHWLQRATRLDTQHAPPVDDQTRSH